MADERVVRHARLLVAYSLGVRPGQLVLIQAGAIAAPLVRELYRELVRSGAHPLPRIALDGVADELLARGTDAQLDWVNPRARHDYEHADARIYVRAEANTRAQSRADPSRQARLSRALRPLAETSDRRSASGELAWVVTAFPTNAAAQEAGMSLAAYERFVYSALLLDRDDPVAAWRELDARVAALGERLSRVRELRIVAPDTDLTVAVEGRRWIPCGGDKNMPDGEVFTGPLEESAEGTIRFTFPGTFHGRAVSDIRLRFRGGRVVDASARQGEAFLHEMLEVDEGARRIGELAFGLNEGIQRFTGDTLFDEKIGGTMHLALGRSYSESGGTNQSALHWDLVCDLRRGGEVYADGALAYRDGAFLPGW